MPVYNAGCYLKESITSILNQSFTNFEFIIVDDGSTDGSQNLVKSYSDNRIRFFQNTGNLGLAETLNKGIDISNSKYIARMDADDISHKSRFEEQISFMEANVSIGVSGSWVWNFDKSKKFLLRYPAGSRCIESFFVFSNPLCHPSVIVRRDLLSKHNLWYDKNFTAAQDYDLWLRCSNYTSIDNICKPLVRWRKNERSITWGQSDLSNRKTMEILTSMLRKLNLKLSTQELIFHREVGNGSGARGITELWEMYCWLEKIIEANSRYGVFNSEGLLHSAGFVWFRICLNSSGHGLKVFDMYRKSSLRKWYNPEPSERLYFYMNSLLRFNKTATGRVYN
jgi:glycosyltransferase involved in cell wall biosynthesis